MNTTIKIFVATILLTSCSIFESLKPPENFYCEINGNKFRPRKDNSPIGGIGANPIRKYLPEKDSIYSIYVDGNDQFIGLNLKLKNLDRIDVGEYLLSNDRKKNWAILDPDISTFPRVTLYSDAGFIKITKSEGFKIWGTFEFTCKNSKNGNVFKVIKGEFNNPQN